MADFGQGGFGQGGFGGITRLAWRWGSLFRTLSVTSVTSEATNYPVSRLVTLDSHPLIRTWRSTSTAQQDIVLDLGSALSFQAVALFNTNFSSVQLAHSADNVSYTNLTGSPFTINQHLVDGYRKLFRVQSITNRYIRIRIPTQTPTDGAAYFSLGMVIIVQTLNTLPRKIQLPLRQPLDRPYLVSGAEVIPAGPFFIEQEWQMILETTNLTQLQNIALVGAHTPVLVFENTGMSEEVYLMRYVGAVPFTQQGIYQEINPTWQEMT